MVPVPAVSELHTQLHDTQSSLASHVDKVRALGAIFAEHGAIKREASLLRSLVEGVKGALTEDNEEEFVNNDDDDAGSICTVAPHKLQRVEEDEKQDVDEGEERRRRRSELGRSRTPEPTNLRMAFLEDEETISLTKPMIMIEDVTSASPHSHQLKTALELSSSPSAVHRHSKHHFCPPIEVRRIRDLRHEYSASPPIIETLHHHRQRSPSPSL